MAPLKQALQLEAINANDFKGDVDPEWSINKITFGGYLFALIVEACVKFQSTKHHVDPLHVTAHFLKRTLKAPVTVRVREVRSGAGLTHLTAELMQDDTVNIMAHAVFSLNEPGDGVNLTLNPPSPWARRHPLHLHPSQAKPQAVWRTWEFGNHVQWAEDEDILARNKLGHSNRTDSRSIGGGSVEWGAWFEFTDKEKKISNPLLALLADVFRNAPQLLPKDERPDLKSPSWFPTIVLSIEFKNKLQRSSKYSDRTVGIYSSGRFITHPQGRHETHVEIWTSPSNIGEGEFTENWRDDQVCLAIASQMSLTIPAREEASLTATSAKL